MMHFIKSICSNKAKALQLLMFAFNTTTTTDHQRISLTDEIYNFGFELYIIPISFLLQGRSAKLNDRKTFVEAMQDLLTKESEVVDIFEKIKKNT
jgi:hypothetical protein